MLLAAMSNVVWAFVPVVILGLLAFQIRGSRQKTRELSAELQQPLLDKLDEIRGEIAQIRERLDARSS